MFAISLEAFNILKMRHQYTIYLLIFCVSSNNLNAQVKDCYPNCNITFEQVASHRCPSNDDIVGISPDWIAVSSVDFNKSSPNQFDLGGPCGDPVNAMLKQFRDEDQANSTYLRNVACAYTAGWIEKQKGECQAGGPPPCCPVQHWEKIDPVIATKKYNDDQAKIFYERLKKIENSINACRNGLYKNSTTKFNDNYSISLTDLQQAKLYPLVFPTTDNDKYVSELNNIHSEFQSEINKGSNASYKRISELIKQLQNIIDELQKIIDQGKLTKNSPKSSDTLSNSDSNNVNNNNSGYYTNGNPYNNSYSNSKNNNGNSNSTQNVTSENKSGTHNYGYVKNTSGSNTNNFWSETNSNSKNKTDSISKNIDSTNKIQKHKDNFWEDNSLILSKTNGTKINQESSQNNLTAENVSGNP